MRAYTRFLLQPRWIALVASKWVHRRIVKKLSLWSSWTCAILVIFNGRKFVNVCFGLGLEARVLKNTERIRVFSRYCDSFSLRFLFVYDHLLIKDFCTSKLFSMSLFIHRTRTMEVGLSELIIGLLQFENFVDQCHKGLTARLLRYRTPYELDPFSCLQALRKITWATISSEHNDVIRYESAKMDYIRRSNIIKISGGGRIVTELGIELHTYPLRDQVIT
ncbi:hypothetical protein DY000_02019371 [Brassica cretica]|uniref:Uncharacterized protein n=1 Tax=Brassica cretica TaxID=69181 RepID=A0ABQ7DB06_BRACR|nr:hypothetical protein DY000_02019371 [Brassica cretica]